MDLRFLINCFNSKIDHHTVAEPTAIFDSIFIILKIMLCSTPLPNALQLRIRSVTIALFFFISKLKKPMIPIFPNLSLRSQQKR